MLTALEAADLDSVLSGKETYTVFAPTDEAFAKLPEGTVENLLKLKNKEQLKAILLYQWLGKSAPVMHSMRKV